MRLLLRSPTRRRPLESKARQWGKSNSPGAIPFFPHSLMYFPSFENFTIALPPSPPCPSEMNISPLGANATAFGWLSMFGPEPATPAVPSVINIFPSGENLNTWWPLPSLPWLSVTHTFPSASTLMPWGMTMSPPPKLCSTFPVSSNSQTGSSLESAQDAAIKPFTPHLSATQMWLRLSTATPPVEPKVRPSGILNQPLTVRYGLGAELIGGPVGTGGSSRTWLLPGPWA